MQCHFVDVVVQCWRRCWLKKMAQDVVTQTSLEIYRMTLLSEGRNHGLNLNFRTLNLSFELTTLNLKP